MTKAIPQGHNTITPSIMVNGAAEAIELYKRALGAKEISVLKSPNGGDKIMHACLEIGNSRVFLADAMPNCGAPSNSSFYLYVEDADSAFKKAKAAGLTEKFPPTEMFWGDRMGSVQDKFGIHWTLATHVRDVSQDELKKGAQEFAARMANKAA